MHNVSRPVRRLRPRYMASWLLATIRLLAILGLKRYTAKFNNNFLSILLLLLLLLLEEDEVLLTGARGGY